MSIFAFLIATGLFIGSWVLKNEIKSAVEKISEVDSPFTNMYKGIEENADKIFVSLCEGKQNIQSCPSKDLDTIFAGNVPDTYWFDLAYWMERSVKCSGLVNKLDIYYFTNWQYEFVIYQFRSSLPEESCGKRVQRFIDGTNAIFIG